MVYGLDLTSPSAVGALLSVDVWLPKIVAWFVQPLPRRVVHCLFCPVGFKLRLG
jgi:hypothetical protein